MRERERERFKLIKLRGERLIKKAEIPTKGIKKEAKCIQHSFELREASGGDWDMARLCGRIVPPSPFKANSSRFSHSPPIPCP